MISVLMQVWMGSFVELILLSVEDRGFPTETQAMHWVNAESPAGEQSFMLQTTAAH
jgi:hypothetical protein